MYVLNIKFTALSVVLRFSIITPLSCNRGDYSVIINAASSYILLFLYTISNYSLKKLSLVLGHNVMGLKLTGHCYAVAKVF